MNSVMWINNVHRHQHHQKNQSRVIFQQHHHDYRNQLAFVHHRPQLKNHLPQLMQFQLHQIQPESDEYAQHMAMELRRVHHLLNYTKVKSISSIFYEIMISVRRWLVVKLCAMNVHLGKIVRKYVFRLKKKTDFLIKRNVAVQMNVGIK